MGLTPICGPEQTIPFPYDFLPLLPPNTWVAKFDTDDEDCATGALVFDTLANTGLPSRLIARR